MYGMAAKQTIIETYRKPLARGFRPAASSNILLRLQKHDPTAVTDCLRAYGDKIWSFSIKATDSIPQAEILASEIFQDIWSYATSESNDLASDEHLIIEHIATRRAIKYRWERRR